MPTTTVPIRRLPVASKAGTPSSRARSSIERSVGVSTERSDSRGGELVGVGGRAFDDPPVTVEDPRLLVEHGIAGPVADAEPRTGGVERRELGGGALAQDRGRVGAEPIGEHQVQRDAEDREPGTEDRERSERDPPAQAHRSTYPTPRAVAISSLAPSSRSLRRSRRDVGVERVVVHDRAVRPRGQRELAPAQHHAGTAGERGHQTELGRRQRLGALADGHAVLGRIESQSGDRLGVASPPLRRSSARTRTTSSASANGLVR